MPWKRKYLLRSDSEAKNATRASPSSDVGALSRSVVPSRRMTSTAPSATAVVLRTRDDKRLLMRHKRVCNGLGLEHDLERVRCSRVAERVVRRHRLGEREP